jgi:hypothetical protein
MTPSSKLRRVLRKSSPPRASGSGRAPSRALGPSARRRPEAKAPAAAPSLDPRVADALRRLASGCAAAAVGFEACAKHAVDDQLRFAVQGLAIDLRTAADRADTLGAAFGVERRRGPRTCERLRWEWLASSGKLLDGAPDARLLVESERLLDAARGNVGVVADGLACVSEGRAASKLRSMLELCAAKTSSLLSLATHAAAEVAPAPA